jgi:hypothetical protein
VALGRLKTMLSFYKNKKPGKQRVFRKKRDAKKGSGAEVFMHSHKLNQRSHIYDSRKVI